MDNSSTLVCHADELTLDAGDRRNVTNTAGVRNYLIVTAGHQASIVRPVDLALGKCECQGGVRVLDDRKLAVLRAIVEDYVSTNEPVGSKSIVDRHNLDVSPATIRNDMAVLEEQGFIVQPHTSAGRVPTDKGYRLFVDRLPGVKPFSAAERRERLH